MTEPLPLSPIRRLYRAYLDRYLIFRVLKKVALLAYRYSIYVRKAVNIHSRFFVRRAEGIWFRFWFVMLEWFPSLAQAQRKFWPKGRPAPLLYINYKLVPAEVFVAQHSCQRIVIDAGSHIAIPGPKMFGDCPAVPVWPQQVLLKTPAIEITEITKPTVIGKSDFILYGKVAVHVDLFDPSRDATPEEMHGLASIKLKKRIMKLQLPHPVRKLDVPCAVSLLGGCTGNYVHWLTETLPKLLILDNLPQYRDLPLLVDDDLHPNIVESLNIFNLHNRQILYVKRWEPVTADKIVVISPPAYAPFDYRANREGQFPRIGCDHATYSATALQLLKNTSTTTAPNFPGTASLRVFFRRKSSYRRLQNLVQVEAVLREHGFDVIEPETLRFSEQIGIMRSAKMIVAQAGAALGNMIFAPTGCKVVALSAYTPYNNYYYFSNMAGILGHSLSYAFGMTDQRHKGHPAHTDISTNVEALLEALQ